MRPVNLLLVHEGVPELDRIASKNQDTTREIQCATSGEEALARIEKNTIDIVVLDIDSIGSDGFELCSTIRSKSYHKPIIGCEFGIGQNQFNSFKFFSYALL